GVMIGAGLVALGQFLFILVRSRRQAKTELDATSQAPEQPAAQETAALTSTAHQYTRGDKDVRNAVTMGGGLYLLGALAIALAGGLFTELSIWQLLLFLVFAAVATFA